MAFDLTNFQDDRLDAEYLTYLVERQGTQNAAGMGRLWNYFLNPQTSCGAAGRAFQQAQEEGLPPRITGRAAGRSGGDLTDLRRKEIVIENDIAWRIGVMVDFLFGKGLTIRSLSPDAAKAAAVEAVVSALLEANGGTALLQEMALLGAVYGFVDVALRANPEAAEPRAAASAAASQDGQQDPNADRSRLSLERALDAARALHLETVEAARVLPILDEDDYRRVRYWVQKYCKHPARLSDARRPWLFFGRSRSGPAPAVVEVVEILGPTWWQRYEDRQLVAEGGNPLGRLPVVHIQNVAVPGSYAGVSDVEPLIPLQDELNVRLSDRANRVTFQSFKMYLGKGIDDFIERPVAPGQMWATQNLDAEILEFGSDTGSPSEQQHIDEVRQALDKVSGVTPLAAGLLRGAVGNLTSATALQVVFSGLLARTARKRLTYGAGLQQIVELALRWLDVRGVLRTGPQDRRIEIHWPGVLPADEGQLLRNAQAKAALGVPAQTLLAELGYGNPAANIR